MTRAARALAVVVAAELAVGGAAFARRLARPAPPGPDPAMLDDDTAAAVRAAAAGCEAADGWRKLGELYMAAGCFAEAEACHRVACDRDPGDAAAARQWGFALERLARFDEANAQYRRAAGLKPEWTYACNYFVARNLLRVGKPAEARAGFAEWKAFDPNRYELARLHARAGEADAAAALAHDLVTKRPGVLQAHLLAYRVAADRGDATAMYAHADAARYAVQKLPNPFDEEAARVVGAANGLGAAGRARAVRELVAAGKLDDAERVARDADRAHPHDGFGEVLAELAARRGRFADAAAHLADAEARGGPSARLAAKLGDVRARLGDAAAARAEWLRAAALEAGADLKAVHHQLAASFDAAGDKAAADRHLARGHYYVGRELLKFGYADKAVGYFAAAGRHDPGFAAAWFYLGEARRRSGAPAADAYRECLRLDPDHGRARAALAAGGN